MGWTEAVPAPRIMRDPRIEAEGRSRFRSVSEEPRCSCREEARRAESLRESPFSAFDLSGEFSNALSDGR